MDADENDMDVRGAPTDARRTRVRTPGKHITLFFIVASLMLSLSTTMIGGEPRVKQPAPVRTLIAGPRRLIEFDPILTDLAPDSLGRVTYLRLTPVVAVDGASDEDAVSERYDQIRERMTFMLRQLSPDDLADGEAMERLKTELLRRVNLVIAPARAREVVIHDVIIQ